MTQPRRSSNLENWEMDYQIITGPQPTARKALRRGIFLLDHDDFWVCEFRDGELYRILHSDLEPRECEEGEFEHVKEALR